MGARLALSRGGHRRSRLRAPRGFVFDPALRASKGRIVKARLTLAAIALALPLMAAASPSDFRFTRKIEAPEGWTRIDLPDDLLAARRPRLPHLRVLSPSGTEVAY